PRLALVERIALAFIERQPDGAFAGPAPDPVAAPAPSIGGFASARAAIDFTREVELGGEGESRAETRPYRAIGHAVFLPWAVSVFELVAPRAEADALLEKVLGGASFEKPVPTEAPPTS